ncbi:hypothetical protein SC171_27535 [Pantoea cypripedii]|uniref:hypothetical protein n=1 Tax=Pantoea cypripedii TaxID=55209 RepID=UPI002FC7A9C8
MFTINSSTVRTPAQIQTIPDNQKNHIAVTNASNTSQTIRSSPSPVLGPGSLHDLLTKKTTTPETIMEKLNILFYKNQDNPGAELNSILTEFKYGNHVHRAHFNALLTLLDNGMENNDYSAMQLAQNLTRGFEKRTPDMKNEHERKLLSSLASNYTFKKGRAMKTQHLIAQHENTLKALNSQRQAKISALKSIVKDFSPESKDLRVTPYENNYKKDLSIESYHFKDENGKVFEATLIDNQDKNSSININNAKKVIEELYQGNRGAKVSEIKLPNEKGETQTQVVTLFDRTNLVTLEQYMGNQDKQNTPWTLDSAAIAYGNKKGHFTVALGTLDKFHAGLKQLHKDKEFAFPSYGYLNRHNILSDQNGSEAFFHPAPLLIRDIFKEQHMHNAGDAESHRVLDPIFDKDCLSDALRMFSTTQRATEDLYSMAMLWGKTFGLNMFDNTTSPFCEAFDESLMRRSKKTSEQLKKDLSKDTTYTLDDVKKLCSGRAGEKELIKHVEDCLKNPQACKASPKLILETATMLLSQTKASFAQSAKAWS